MMSFSIPTNGATIMLLGVWMFLSSSPLPAQTPEPSPYLEDHVRHLIGIQNRMKQSLDHLRNHTCRIDIRRAHLGAKAREKVARKLKKFNAKGREGATSFDVPMDGADSVALEVAIIDRKELYAFPDSDRFEDRSLGEIIGHGTVSSGSFAGHARDILVNGAATIRYVGEESLDGGQVRRYDYTVAQFRSGYSIANKGQSATVPYYGSFWATADTDELVRLMVQVDDIPNYVGIDNVVTQIDYQALILNDQAFIVPRQTRLNMSLSTGVDSINEFKFSNCRSFVGSSVLSFDEVSDRFYAEKTEAITNVAVPPGLELPMRLATVIDSETAKVGTPVEAELTRDVRIDTDSVLPEGTLLTGRIRRFEFYKGADAHYVVGLEFRELTFDSGHKRAAIALALQQISSKIGAQQNIPPRNPSRHVSGGGYGQPTIERRTVDTYEGHSMPGVGVFYVQKRKFKTKPGMRMTWRTVSAAESRGEQVQ